jgi:septum formation protein
MKLVLGSNSPRRVELLRHMGIEFEQRAANIDEQIDSSIPLASVPESIALRKMNSLLPSIASDEILLCADTLVFVDEIILSKPSTVHEAESMLQMLSGRTHTVITGVCIGNLEYYSTFSDQTLITFDRLNKQEITHYINHYNVLDRAGAYGIQDWIGLVGIRHIEGSYTNVMGLPTHKVYHALREFIN